MRAFKRLSSKMDVQEFRCTCNEEEIRFSNDIGESVVKWKLFHKLQITKEFWFLYSDQVGCRYFPTHLLSDELKKLILTKMEENKIPIKGRRKLKTS